MSQLKGRFMKTRLFQLFNMSFCVTGMPTNAPSREDYNLRISRWAGEGLGFRLSAQVALFRTS